MALTLNTDFQIDLLLQLSLGARPSDVTIDTVASASREDWARLLALSESHHVVVRAFHPLERLAREKGYEGLADWCVETLAREHARIAKALEVLDDICVKLEGEGIQITVMKSLDHWPDIGNDLDLYTRSEQKDVGRAMLKNFAAAPKGRTWGDRLARKNNFGIQGLRESVEIHHGVLGQTGEHTALARRFCIRRVPQHLDGYTFMVPAPEEQIIAATLQRMYRHLYIRVCDIVNTHNILESGKLDMAELRHAADIGGIWPGVATYLRIVTEFVRQYRGRACQLSPGVLASARFGMEEVTIRGIWLRVPVRRAARFYGSQLGRMARRRDVHGVFRLSLLPPLASVARLVYKLTGDHKGIW